MRNLAVTTMLLIYLTSQVGSVFMYYYRPVIHAISQVRQQRRMRENHVALKDVTLTIAEYKASIYEEKELKLNGTLYDVKKIVFKGHFVRLQLLEDKQETNLLNSYRSFLHAFHQQEQSQKKSFHTWSWLQKIYSCEDDLNLPFICSTQELKISLVNTFIPPHFLSQPGQPPELNS